ncbi:AraC-type DNA-binding protein [Actinopolymorpha cephalotaxi]|uniref:AraC-like DNA-binding protein n=1 Tax=Actinopolymorpha cephalotaxi TaxID=504797 RepID=A0A1I2YID4_9ACTN|nr:AraC family transcriptional regulator [Actinopolymorpha cephalotaxi]NYH86955.1 AraC-like DNA-binding protein [Actinopolymorpha cephalotaxi]SFH25372.1 AraC-type DNA-binding protein [Actinopolymorpha cephalotaxi]
MHEVAVQAARFLAAHATEPIRLGDVADHVGYSPFHLSRIFERHLGLPPGQFVGAHRFQHAKRLLLDGDERIIDVCFAVGFTSVGTFTSRFAASVGVGPGEFRRIPDTLAAGSPRPVSRPGGDRNGGVVTGVAHLSPGAMAALGGSAAVYVGVFARRAPRGTPVSGALLDDSGGFVLTGIPPGSYWLLASALPGRADPLGQLLPERGVTGHSPWPVRVTAAAPPVRRDVHLDLTPSWSAPVVVALPPLACGSARLEKTAAGRTASLTSGIAG